jgi:hypothetical protein
MEVSMSRFVSLIESIADVIEPSAGFEAEIDESPDGACSVDVRLGEVVFQFAHAAMADDFMLYCDFGPLPETGPFESIKKLMELNLVLAANGQGSIGFDTQSGEVLHAFRADIRKSSPAALIKAMKSIAAWALAWRSGRGFCTAIVPSVQSGPRASFA